MTDTDVGDVFFYDVYYRLGLCLTSPNTKKPLKYIVYAFYRNGDHLTKAPKKVACANSGYSNEAVHDEPPHLDLRCLPSTL